MLHKFNEELAKLFNVKEECIAKRSIELPYELQALGAFDGKTISEDKISTKQEIKKFLAAL